MSRNTRAPRKRSSISPSVVSTRSLCSRWLAASNGLLRPSRSEGNTRLYTEEDLERLEVVLAMTRELGVNLAGVEVILNMREKMERLQEQVEDFVGFVNAELERMRDRSMQERFRNALVRVGPRARPPAPAEEATSQAKVKA